MSDAVTRIKAPVRLGFTVTAGRDLSRFLAAIAEGRFLGRRLGEEVRVADTGTLTTFCIVNIPVEGRSIELPYVYGSILLDGADIAFPHLIQGLPAADVRMGLRVRAEWAAERQPTMESVLCFRPTGEPDAPFDAYKEHL
jgi:hypothetical protein